MRSNVHIKMKMHNKKDKLQDRMSRDALSLRIKQNYLDYKEKEEERKRQMSEEEY